MFREQSRLCSVTRTGPWGIRMNEQPNFNLPWYATAPAPGEDTGLPQSMVRRSIGAPGNARQVLLMRSRRNALSARILDELNQIASTPR